MNTETHEGSVEDAGIAGASIVVKTDVLPPQSDSEYCDTMVALDQSHGDASVGLTHEECMKTIADERSQGGGITVGSTTTDENGAYELTLISDIDTYIISTQGGSNMVTGEPNDSTFTVSSKVGYHVNPASELASDLIGEGMSVEEAKDKVIEFVNSDLANVASLGGATEPLSKEDLFNRSMTKDMESQNRKGAMKAVVFNTLNNIKEMLVEAVEADAPSAEEVEKEVRKAIAKELRLINHKEGQNVNISNLVESAIDRVGEEIELVELKEVSKKSIIGSTINSQSHELTSIDLGDGNVYRSIAAVETKRHEIKDEKSMVEQLVKIDVSVESDDESKLSVLKNIKSAKKEEIEEERKTREPINFDSKLDKIKERLELQDQIFDLIEEAGSQIAYVRGITKYDEKEFLSILKVADSINAEFDELKSEIKERNDIEDLGFDEGKFEKVQSAIDELYAILKKQQQLLSEVPTLKPIDGVKPIDGKDPVKDEPKEVFERGTEGYYELYKTDLDLIYNNYKDKYTPFDYPNKSHLVLEEYYVNLFNEILENHSDLIDKLQSVGEYDVFERFANVIRNYQREQFGEHESQIISQVFYNISSYGKWKHQIDNTFNSRLLDGLKDRINANFSYVHSNYNTKKTQDHTSMNEYEIRDYVGQTAIRSLMANKVVDLLNEKINKGLENPVWVNLNDLKVVDLDEYGCGIFDFIKEENKVAFKKGDYVTDVLGSNQTHINVNDFKISEDGWKFYSTFYGETGYGYVGLPAQTKYGLSEGLNIVFILLPNSVNEDWKFHAMRPNFNNGGLNAAYPEDGSSDSIIGLDNVRKNNPEGNILMGINNRPYTGIAQYWYNLLEGYPTESTYEGFYKKQKEQFASEVSRSKGLYPSYRVHAYQFFGADASKPELGVQAMYRLQAVNRFNDGNDSVFTKDYYQLNNWFTTRTNVGVMTDDLSGNLYLKYDEINVPYLYTKDGDTYSKYSGYAYTKRDQQANMTSQNLWNERFNGEYYVVVGGAIMNDQAGRVFQINQFRGWKDCDGLERTSINRISPWTISYSSQLNSNRPIDPEFAGWTLKLKNNISGEEESVNLDDYSVLYDVWSNDKPAVQLRDLMLKYLCNDSTNGNRLVDYGFDFENKVLSLTMVTSGYARGLGQFGITDETGNFNWASENCEDTDGDGVYDQIDGWPNDPAYSYDYDGDGIADEVDEFPYDKEPTYSVCKDMITNNYHVIPTDVSKFIDGQTQFVYMTESKEGRVAHAFEFEGVVSENTESYPVISLSSESRFFHTEFKYGGPIEMVQQLTSKEGGKK